MAVIEIQVDGSEIPGNRPMGWSSRPRHCTIDGLSLTGFGGAAIALEIDPSNKAASGSDTIWGNFIGVTRFSPTTYNTVDPTANPDANGVGIRIESPNNLIGGTSPSDRNVIQGNSGSGDRRRWRWHGEHDRDGLHPG